MTPHKLAILLEDLIPKITPQEWWISSTLYHLSIKHIKEFRTAGKGIRNVCVLATCGIAKTPEKEAEAALICLLKNNLPIILDALKHSTRAGHAK